MTSEIIEPGKFRGKTACCFAGVLCLPAALAAGTTDGFIVVTYCRDTGAVSGGQSSPLLQQGKYSKPRKSILLAVAAVLFGLVAVAVLVSHFEDKGSESGASVSAQPTARMVTPTPPLAPSPVSVKTTIKAPKVVNAADSQKRAIALYPDLGVSGSPLNREFLRRYNGLKASGDPLLQEPDWPEKLAKQSSDALSVSSQLPPTTANPNGSVAPINEASTSEAASSLCNNIAKNINLVADFTNTLCIPAKGRQTGFVSFTILSEKPVFGTPSEEKWLLVAVAAAGLALNNDPSTNAEELCLSDTNLVTEGKYYVINAARAKSLQQQISGGTITLEQMSSALTQSLILKTIPRQ